MYYMCFLSGNDNIIEAFADHLNSIFETLLQRLQPLHDLQQDITSMKNEQIYK